MVGSRIVVLCHIASWSSVHALALAQLYTKRGYKVEFLVVSANWNNARAALDDYRSLVEGCCGHPVLGMTIYESSKELFAWILGQLESTVKGVFDEDSFLLPSNEFRNFSSPSIGGLHLLKGNLSKEGKRLVAFDHGPGDWLSLYDDSHVEALGVADEVLFSSDAPLYFKDRYDCEKVSIVDPGHLAGAIRLFAEYFAKNNDQLGAKLESRTESVFIVGGTYDFAIGEDCFESYLAIAKAAKRSGMTCFFKPHKHYYAAENGPVLDAIRREGAVVIEEIALNAEALIELLRPKSVFGVCTSVLKHSWRYLNIPAYSVTDAKMVRSLLNGEFSRESGRGVSGSRYRFLEIMMNAINFPNYQWFLNELEKPNWRDGYSESYMDELDRVDRFAELHRSALPAREHVFSKRLNRLERTCGKWDEFYVSALDKCAEKGWKFAVFGTGEGGRDLHRLSARLGLTPSFYIDKSRNELFEQFLKTEVLQWGEIEDGRLASVDAVIVSSITYGKEIFKRIEGKCLRNGVEIVCC